MRKRTILNEMELMPHRSSERACFYGREDAIKIIKSCRSSCDALE